MPPPPPPPPVPPPPVPPPAPAPAPASSGSKTVIVILCILLGLFLLIGGCIAACTYIVGKKVKEAGKNPQYTALSLWAGMNPEVTVVNRDPDRGQITVKNKATGETVTLNSSDWDPNNSAVMEQKMIAASQGAIAAMAGAAAAADNSSSNQASTPASAPVQSTPSAPVISSGKASAMAATLKAFPDFVPKYSNGTTTSAESGGFGAATLGSYGFTSSDSTDAISSYYQKKITGSGFTIITQANGSNDNGPTAMFIANRASPQATVTFNAESQGGGTVKVSVNFTQTKQQ